MALSLISAIAAAICYGVANVVQSAGVRHLGAAPTGMPVIRRAWVGRWYGVGLCLDGVGFIASVTALRTLPLFVVQSAVAASVGVTAVLAAVMHRVRLRGRQVATLLVLGAGLVALGLSAPAQPPVGLSRLGDWLLLAGVVPMVGLAVGLWYRRNVQHAFLGLAACAGCGFAGSGIAARVMIVPSPWWHLVTQPAAWALAAYGIQGSIYYGLALARGHVTAVAALGLAVQTVVPGAVGLTLLGDHVRHGFWPLALSGFVATLGACLLLAVSYGVGQPEPSNPRFLEHAHWPRH